MACWLTCGRAALAAGCATERSRNMSQWWVDWVKRLGCDICSDLVRRGARSAFDLSGCVTIQIGQVRELAVLALLELWVRRGPVIDGRGCLMR